MRLKEFLDIQEELGGLGHPSSSGMALPKASGTVNPTFYAAWKKKMQAKGAVKFEKVELDTIMAYDKDGKGVGAYDIWGNVGHEMNEAAKPGDHDYDGQPTDIDTFWVAGWNEEEGKSWIGEVTNNGSKWVETNSKGATPDSWGGKRYMNYLSANEVMDWLNKDYDEVDGPFFDKLEAIEHAEHKFGPLSVNEAEGKAQQFVIMANVSGGVTGNRTAPVRQGGKILKFDSEQEAQEHAKHLTQTANRQPSIAQFKYWAAPYRDYLHKD